MSAASAESAAEAKHRRAPPPASPAADAAPGAAEDVEAGAVDAAKKRRRTLLGAVRALALSTARGARRKRNDLLAGGALLVATAVGYVYATVELLQPPESAAVQLERKLGHFIFAFFIANALAVILHGPGRMPSRKHGQGWQPAPAIEAALEVGRFSRFRPFKGTEEWCFECNDRKPPLVHHCSVCGRCSLWMDHHCNILGQCVGFRNLRCFVCFAASAQLLVVFLLLLSLQRVVADARLDGWVVGRLLLFDCVMAYGLKVSRSHLRFVLLKISQGWMSGVLLQKFMDAAGYAQQIAHAYADMPSSAMRDLTAACQRVLWPSGGLRGLFAAEGRLGGLTVAFGEPPSWRWLLPLRPGGRGDPLRPAEFSEDACQAWAALAKALEAHHEVMAQAQRLMALREQAADPGEAPPARTAEDAFSA